MTNNMLDAALAYAKRGWKVFPALILKNKKGSWQKLGRYKAKDTNNERWGATSDPETIERYWRKHRSDRIGIPTGSTNGIFCIDVDTATVDGHKYDGFASLQKLEVKYGPLPATLKSRSPSGSEHHYFRASSDVLIKNSASELVIEGGERALGVDVRGEGGMVIAPPSTHPRGGQYVWINDLDIAPAPDWLIELVRKPDVPQRRAGAKRSRPPSVPAATIDAEGLAAMVACAGMGISLRPEDNAPDERLKLEAALAHIEPAALNYLDWFRIGCAIYDGLRDDGFALFDEWSRQSAHYDKDGCEAKWNECRQSRSIRVDTAYWYADQHDRDWRAWYQRLVAAGVQAS
jgi:hypothetical protein